MSITDTLAQDLTEDSTPAEAMAKLSAAGNALRNNDSSFIAAVTEALADVTEYVVEKTQQLPADKLEQLTQGDTELLQKIKEVDITLKEARDMKPLDAWVHVIQGYQQAFHGAEQARASKEIEYGFGALDFSKTVTSFLGGIGVLLDKIGLGTPMTNQWVEDAKNFDTEFAQGVSYRDVRQAQVNESTLPSLEFNAQNERAGSLAYFNDPQNITAMNGILQRLHHMDQTGKSTLLDDAHARRAQVTTRSTAENQVTTDHLIQRSQQGNSGGFAAPRPGAGSGFD